MKFLEVPELALLTTFLTGHRVGERVIFGKLEAYSCKSAGEDKRLARTLERQYEADLSTSPNHIGFSRTNLGDMNQPATRKLLINLISTLNASDPDYDYSSLTADDFAKVDSIESMAQNANHYLSDIVEEEDPKFLETLWTAIDRFIDLKECEVFTYVRDDDSDPDATALWSFNYFFLNRKQKQILYFSCYARGNNGFRSHTPGILDDENMMSQPDEVDEDDIPAFLDSQEDVVDRDADMDETEEIL